MTPQTFRRMRTAYQQQGTGRLMDRRRRRPSARLREGRQSSPAAPRKKRSRLQSLGPEGLKDF
ncbi:MAG: hypothetical protein D4R73_04870 [Deltaproteobacteria bacterium]|nr:MAG: hypothetical protein D4R73_04870 [Deltaproteobacteria bacterium]